MTNNKIVYFEFDSENIEETVHFYSHIFNWKFRKSESPQKYWLIDAGDERNKGINGALLERDVNSIPSMVNLISVDDIDSKIQMIKDHGGEIIAPRTEVPNLGVVVYFEDTQGNIFGMLEKK